MYEQMEEQVCVVLVVGGFLGIFLSEGDKKDMCKFFFLKVLCSVNEGV